jgi:hypothetical protein
VKFAQNQRLSLVRKRIFADLSIPTCLQQLPSWTELAEIFVNGSLASSLPYLQRFVKAKLKLLL